jgi:hypothetical protein
MLSLSRTVAIGLAFAAAAGQALAQSKPEAVDFDPAKVVAGISISRDECAALERKDTAIWVEAGGTSTCMRY